MPLARVVLPAPRLPIKRTTAGGENSRAREAPRETVSSADFVSKTRVSLRLNGTLPHRAGQEAEEVAGDDAFLAESAGGELARAAVQPHGGEEDGGDVLGELREESGDHSGEDVTGAGCGHGGRASGVDPDRAFGRGDETAIAF